MKGVIYNRCPAMETFTTDDPMVRITDILYTDVVIVVNGIRSKGWLRFPPTKIHKHGVARFIVDSCTAEGHMEEYGSITVTLDPEQVLGPLALPVKATGEVGLGDLGFAKISMTYPWVLSTPRGGGDWLVGPVTAKGTLGFGEVPG